MIAAPPVSNGGFHESLIVNGLASDLKSIGESGTDGAVVVASATFEGSLSPYSLNALIRKYRVVSGANIRL